LSLQRLQFGLRILLPLKTSQTLGRPKFLYSRTNGTQLMREGISQPWILCWPMISSSPSRTEAHSANLDISHNGDSTVHVEISAMSDLRVRMHGNTAVVTGRYHEKGRSKDKPYEYRDRFTDVWMKINGRWQVIGIALQCSGQPIILFAGITGCNWDGRVRARPPQMIATRLQSRINSNACLRHARDVSVGFTR